MTRPVCKRLRKLPHSTDPEQEAARRLLDTVIRWRLKIFSNGRRKCVTVEVGGSGGDPGRLNPGPPLDIADLDTVASLGATASHMVARLREWAEKNGAEEMGPIRALGYLRALADHGEAEAVKRWPMVATPAEEADGIPQGLDALRAAHSQLLAKPGPCAVLRALLADPDKLWSAPTIAADDIFRDAYPAGRADDRSVGRWLNALAADGLAHSEGMGTAKRWRLGPAAA